MKSLGPLLPRPISIIMLLIVLLLPSLSAGQDKELKIEKNSKKILCILPVTGEYSILGNMALRGVLAAKETSGSDDYEVVVIDTGVTSVSSAFSKAVGEYDPAFLIGPVPNSQLEKLDPEDINKNIPVVVFPVGKEKVIPAPNLVKFHYPVDMQTYQLVDFISDNVGLSKFAVLYPDTEMGREFRDSYRNSVRQKGKSLAYEGSYDPYTLDIAQEIKWIETVKPDVIFIPDGASRSSIIIKKLLKNRGLFNTFFVGPGTWNSEAFKRDIDSKIDGIIYKTLFTDFIDMNGERWSGFKQIYRELFGENPGTFEYRVYEVTSYLIEIDKHGRNGGSLLEKLSAMDEQGREYRIRQTENGIDIYPKPMIFTLKDGKIIRVN